MRVAQQCTTRFLGDLPAPTRLVILFGLGSKRNYAQSARTLLENARPGHWKTINDVAYSDRHVTFVHVEHFASQGALIPNWLGENSHERAHLGLLAKEAVAQALHSAA